MVEAAHESKAQNLTDSHLRQEPNGSLTHIQRAGLMTFIDNQHKDHIDNQHRMVAISMITVMIIIMIITTTIMMTNRLPSLL